MSETPSVPGPDTHTDSTTLPEPEVIADTDGEIVTDDDTPDPEPAELPPVETDESVPESSGDTVVSDDKDSPAESPTSVTTSESEADSDIPPGAAEPTNPAPVLNDPNAAQFQSATGDIPEGEDAPEPPEEATGDTVGTAHNEFEPDDTVEVAPVPTEPGDGRRSTDEWSGLRSDVDEILSKVAEIHELVMQIAPSVRKVGQDVESGGLAGLMSGMFTRR